MAAPEASFRVLSLDEAETVPILGGAMQWVPVRRRLGIGAFGANAYRAERAGDRVVEDHVESPGQEELYVVVRGGARFTIGDEEVDAPAGTAVFVPRPEDRRGAVALEDDTIVLAVGGWLGRAYHSLPWEPIYLAQGAMRRGDWAEAAEILEREAGERINRPIIQFRIACCHAQAGAHEEALRALSRAIELEPTIRERAASEAQLEPLHELEGWQTAMN